MIPIKDMIFWLRSILTEEESDATSLIEAVAEARAKGLASTIWDEQEATARRTLRQVQAHRAILDLHPHRRFKSLPEEWPERWRADVKVAFPDTEELYVGCESCDFNRDYEVFEPGWWCAHVRALASIYSDRDGYNPDWSA